MSKPVDIKIAHINTQDQNKSSFDKDKIFEVFQMTINLSIKEIHPLNHIPKKNQIKITLDRYVFDDVDHFQEHYEQYRGIVFPFYSKK
mgnify:CR=1 FL=1